MNGIVISVIVLSVFVLISLVIAIIALTKKSSTTYSEDDNLNVNGNATINGVLTASGGLNIESSTDFKYSVVPDHTQSSLGYVVQSTDALKTSFGQQFTAIASILIPCAGYWLLSASLTFGGLGYGVRARYVADGETIEPSLEAAGGSILEANLSTLTMYTYLYKASDSVFVSLEAQNNNQSNSVAKIILLAVRIA